MIDMKFSPDGKQLAIASQDGYLRVVDYRSQRYFLHDSFHYRNTSILSYYHLLQTIFYDRKWQKCRLIIVFRSHYGGFLCTTWSPDGKFVVVILLIFCKKWKIDKNSDGRWRRFRMYMVSCRRPMCCQGEISPSMGTFFLNFSDRKLNEYRSVEFVSMN